MAETMSTTTTVHMGSHPDLRGHADTDMQGRPYPVVTIQDKGRVMPYVTIFPQTTEHAMGLAAACMEAVEAVELHSTPQEVLVTLNKLAPGMDPTLRMAIYRLWKQLPSALESSFLFPLDEAQMRADARTEQEG